MSIVRRLAALSDEVKIALASALLKSPPRGDDSRHRPRIRHLAELQRQARLQVREAGVDQLEQVCLWIVGDVEHGHQSHSKDRSGEVPHGKIIG